MESWGGGQGLAFLVLWFVVSEVWFPARSSRHDGTELSMGPLAGTHVGGLPTWARGPDWACVGAEQEWSS